MRIPCPLCGERDSQEFTYLGAAEARRPDGMDADPERMFEYVYLRENPAGVHREYWHHLSGCYAWLTVTRNTRTHEIAAVEMARQAHRGEAA